MSVEGRHLGGWTIRRWWNTHGRHTGLMITVLHYPPGTSKWNKIEHRLFSFISMNWRGRSLTDIRTIVELNAQTNPRRAVGPFSHSTTIWGGHWSQVR